MGKKLEDKAVEVIDKALDGMDQLTVMLAEVAEKYGPEVVDAGLAVARITAASTLIHAAIGVALMVALFKIGISLTYKYRASLDVQDQNDVDFWMPTFFSWFIVGGTIVAISLIGFRILSLFNLWNWVGVIEPKLWIAHRVLNW